MAGQVKITIADKEWIAGLASTPSEQVQGLGGITGIAPGSGMLFDLGYEQHITVTTQPMLFALDIAFFSESLEITEIYQDIQPGYLVDSTVPARFFLEVNAAELDGLAAGNQASVEFLSLQDNSSSQPDWVSELAGFLGFMAMLLLVTGLIKNLVNDQTDQTSDSPVLLPQTKARKEYEIRMDRQGNIVVTHDEQPQRSIFLQFESDKKLIYELLKKNEAEDLENGWPVRIKDTEPRASILSELRETGSRPDLQTKNETQTPAGSPCLPVAQILEKWRTAKSRNSALALKDLETLGAAYDTDDCKQALTDYRGIEPSDYGDHEEFQEARDETWESFLECLESLAGEEERAMAEKQTATIKGKTPTSKGGRLDYLVDSPEYLTQTIEDIGYRDKIDQAFFEAIARARGSR